MCVLCHLISIIITTMSRRLFEEKKYEEAFYACMSFLKKCPEHSIHGLFEFIDDILECYKASEENIEYLHQCGTSVHTTIIAKIHHSNKDYAKAIQYHLSNGSPMDMYLLGNIYRDGDGVKRDEKIAKGYYAKSAIKGNKYGEYEYGMILDEKYGIDWLKTSSNKGYKKASFQVGKIYEKNGRFYKAGSYYANCDTSKLILERLAVCYEKCGHLDSAIRFGIDIIQYGECNLKFYKWLCGLCVTKYTYSTEIVKKYKQYPDWLKILADAGDAAAMCNLGKIYYSRHEECLELFLKSANLGVTQAYHMLGLVYKRDFNDCEKALQWFNKAIEKKYTQSTIRAALISYELGKYTDTVLYYRKGLDLTIEELNEDYSGLKFRSLIIKNLTEIHMLGIVDYETSSETLRFYHKHGLRMLIDTILAQNTEMHDKILTCVYQHFELKYAHKEVLSDEYTNIKEWVESGEYTKCVVTWRHMEIYMEYNERLIDDMKATLNDTSLYVVNLQDIVGEYLFN